MFHFPIKKSTCRMKNAFEEMNDLQKSMDHIFDFAFPGLLKSGTSLLGGQWIPSLDVIDEKDHLLVKVELPGLAKSDIKVSVEDKYLSIRGEKKQDKNLKQEDYLKTERHYGQFVRTIELPTYVDVDKAKATFKSGILELRLLKKKECLPKQIDIDVE